MTGDQHGDRRQRETSEWEAVFADSDPTRVLPSSPAEQPLTDENNGEVSAVRYRAEPETSPVQAAGGEQVVAPRRPAEYGVPAWQQVDTGGEHPYSTYSLPAASPYHRVQFIPAFLGALIAYGINGGVLSIVKLAAAQLGFQSFSSPTGAVLALLDTGTRTAALPWSIALTVSYIVAFTLAGYAAARMSAVAPTRQAVGVILMTLLGLLLGSLTTWATSNASYPLKPSFSGHTFLAENFGVGALTLLGVLLLALMCALLGSLVGNRYHRKLHSLAEVNG